MNSLASNSPFSPHHDVLSANPSTPTEKASLLEELKRRGRASVTSQRYPDALSLYSKAIEVLTSAAADDDAEKNGKDLAILYSNRALCQLQMNNASESYSDATSATCYDATYVKGFWRLGQACVACYDKEDKSKNDNTSANGEDDGGRFSKLEEAQTAYESALKFDEKNKALMKEVDKIKKKLTSEKAIWETKKKEMLEKEEAAGDSEQKKDTKPKTTTKVIPKKSSSTLEEKKSESAPTTTKDDGSFTKSDHVRGYKVINGKKTSFFHHEQTEEEKRLIGDIAPKRIDPNTTTDPSSQANVEKQPSDRSAWNKAGTWEERDCTAWAIKTLEETILEKGNYSLPSTSPDPNATVKVTEVSKLKSEKQAAVGANAHASVATVRGKKRYIFEFTVCVHWTMTLGNGGTCSGTMTFDDVDGSHEIGEGYDVSEYTVKEAPGDSKFLLERFVRNGGLRENLEKAMDGWILLFRETY